ncbi:hypothetical protein BDN70DRAFT_938394 [Pholiota conissans]|uniref:Uncharacterized protein n=1 Tax=Pholiota conissans TaxID=109636 RepID=A0A9P5YLT2_9AGAR|nr:hypothetical protein BDN70DRAFT_938394 [Pholiota conissans]
MVRPISDKLSLVCSSSNNALPSDSSCPRSSYRPNGTGGLIYRNPDVQPYEHAMRKHEAAYVLPSNPPSLSVKTHAICYSFTSLGPLEKASLTPQGLTLQFKSLSRTLCLFCIACHLFLANAKASPAPRPLGYFPEIIKILTFTLHPTYL